MISLSRAQLEAATRKLCDMFSAGASPDELAQLFEENSVVHEYGPATPIAPFLGRDFVGIRAVREYFKLVGDILDVEYMSFLYDSMVVDVERQHVVIRGYARFAWAANNEKWEETFIYDLSIGPTGKVERYEVWADPLSLARAALAA